MMASPTLSKVEQCVSEIGGDGIKDPETTESKGQVWRARNSHDASRRS